jgi:hypothetical protein
VTDGGYVELRAYYQRGRLWSLLRQDERLAGHANLLLDPDLCRYRVQVDPDGAPLVELEVRFATIGWAVVATWRPDEFTGRDLDVIVDALVTGLDVPDDLSSLGTE